MGDGPGGVRAPPSSWEVGRVEGELEVLRGDLAALVGELGRRRREAFDLRLQLRRHPVAVIAVAAGAALLAGALVARAVRARREARRREVPRALARLLEGERRRGGAAVLARELVAAAGTAAGAALVKGLVGRAAARAGRPADAQPERSGRGPR